MSRRRTVTLAVTLLVGIAAGSPAAPPPADPLTQALEDELARSMERLALGDQPRPYFIAYRVEDVRLTMNGTIPVDFYGEMGGVIPSPVEVCDKILEAAKR